MSAAETIAAIHEKLANARGVERLTDQQLADALGVSIALVRRWKGGSKDLTPRQIANLVASVRKSAEIAIFKNPVNTIIEFFQLDTANSWGGGCQEIFSTSSSDGEDHAYYRGIREELGKQHGVYIFYDSRGRAIYVGKAEKQKLWGEIKLTLNRDRGDVQNIYRVRHPSKNYKFKTSEEKARQIARRPVALHEIAAYISVYSMSTGLISKIEALLVRAFANDLLNIRMERLAPRKKAPHASRAAREVCAG